MKDGQDGFTFFKLGNSMLLLSPNWFFSSLSYPEKNKRPNTIYNKDNSSHFLNVSFLHGQSSYINIDLCWGPNSFDKIWIEIFPKLLWAIRICYCTFSSSKRLQDTFQAWANAIIKICLFAMGFLNNARY